MSGEPDKELLQSQQQLLDELRALREREEARDRKAREQQASYVAAGIGMLLWATLASLSDLPWWADLTTAFWLSCGLYAYIVQRIRKK